MKLCVKCMRELFDSDTQCDKCKTDLLLDTREYNQIKNELIQASKLKKKKLLENEKYQCVYVHLGESFWGHGKMLISPQKRECEIYNEQQCKMTTYQCPNCGRMYNYEERKDILYTCINCQTKLKRPDEIFKIENPAKHLIPDKPIKPIVTCPYCNSTDTKKISNTSKAIAVGLFGIFALGKANKEWHCNNCNSDF